MIWFQFLARKFTEQHEWIDVQGKIGVVGVTDYAQSALGDVVFAQLPEPDSELNQMGGYSCWVLMWVANFN